MRRRTAPRRLAAVALALALGGCGAPVTRPTAGYVVRGGDTLYSIAQRFGVDYHELARLNGIGRDYAITPGETLRLPARPSAVARPAPPSAAPTPVAPAPAGSAAPAWLWPVDGTPGETVHQPTGGVGLEITASAGSPVRAAAAGRVAYTGAGLRGYGQLVIIKHDDTWLTAYGYNSAVSVHEGEHVAAGQPIATLGEGPGHRHALYFEIRRNGRPVDPLAALPRRP
jgi:lipoprotein NlpD